MRRPGRLPEGLRDRAFDRAAAADANLTLGRLRRHDLARPFHGVRAADLPLTLVDRCRAYSVRMRTGDLFSHVTAARLHGIPVPAHLEGRTAIDVAAVHPAAAPSTRGVIGHRLRTAPPSVLLDGLPVCRAVEAWCQLAALDLEDLVVAADHLLGDGRGAAATREELLAAIESPGRYRTAALRAALALARVGSWSPQESRLRVVLVREGLPEPALNAEVRARDGRVLGHGDLVWEHARTVLEYEGEQHRTDRNQWAYDIRRYDGFQAEGWTVIRVTADDLRPASRPLLIERVRRALSR